MIFVIGVGPSTAFRLIKENKTIEKVIDRLQRENDDPRYKRKYLIPDPFLYEDARELFLHPSVKKADSLEASTLFL